MSYDIITIGSAVQDVFLITHGFKAIKSKEFPTGKGECFAMGAKIDIEDIYFDTGGGATNTAAAFANLGFKTAAIFKVGRDLSGETIIKELKKYKIASNFVIKDPTEHTAYSTIMLLDEGDRTIFVFRGASANFKISDIPLAKLKTKLLYITSLGGNVELLQRIAASAFKKKINVAINPGSDELKLGMKKLLPILRHIDILILNREEAAALTSHEIDEDIKVLFEDISVATPGIVAITDGINGAYVAPRVTEEEVIYFAPALGGKCLNCTGAGDAFGSALVAGLIKNNFDIEFALRLAIINSGKVVQTMGAKQGLLTKWPSRNQLEKVKVERLKI